jgi:hypothetical protein
MELGARLQRAGSSEKLKYKNTDSIFKLCTKLVRSLSVAANPNNQAHQAFIRQVEFDEAVRRVRLLQLYCQKTGKKYKKEHIRTEANQARLDLNRELQKWPANVPSANLNAENAEECYRSLDSILQQYG